MRERTKFLLIGQVLVDVTLSSEKSENKLRLGGVMHAARAMWAIGLDYSIGYAAPAYLVPLVEEFAPQHGARECRQIGEIDGCPNVVLIPEPTEAGNQGYEFLLREDRRVRTFEDRIADLASTRGITDVLIFPGGIDLPLVLRAFSKSTARICIDAAYDVADLDECRVLEREFEVVMISTSSDLFRKYEADPVKLKSAVLDGIGRSLIFKENRGGGRLFSIDKEPIEFGAQVRPIQHSVGVGDCFDVIFTALRLQHPEQAALAYASFVAAEYASTTYPEDFKLAAERVLGIAPDVITTLEGVRVPWEARSRIDIYIAAPDFDYEDRSMIEVVCNALRYHNFCPRRPVLEHGQLQQSDSSSRRAHLFQQDMELLDRCQILLAVLLSNDPGTLIEIGLAKEKRKPVIVFDPNRMAKNLVLQRIPDVLACTLDEAIAGVFQHASKQLQRRS